MPQAISVTKRHFPGMEHVGNITKLNGAALPPVDIISFGSPCQGLSAAGKRKGLSDPRSGLFSEAIRIITEMREATNGKYPTWAVWENVPGALSSNSGADFKAVLEAFAETQVPFPASNRWTNAGMVRGGGCDIAWCVYNAQHFGVAQRRRRIFLVADFGGERAGEILFVPKSLRGYFEARRAAGQSVAANAESGAGDAASLSANVKDIAATIFAGYGNHWNGNAGAYDGGNFALSPNDDIAILNDQGGDSLNVEKGHCSPTLRSQTHGNLPVVASPVNCLTPWDTQQSRVFTEDGVSSTLAGADGGGGRNPAGLVIRETAVECAYDVPVAAAFLGNAGAKARSIGYSEEVSPTIKSGSSSPCLCAPAGHDAVGVHQNGCGELHVADTAYTLATNGNASARNAPLVCTNLHAYSLDGANSNSMLSPNIHSGCRVTETARTIDTTNPCPSKNQGGVAILEVHPEITGTLCASGAGLSRPGGMASETDLCVVMPNVEPAAFSDTAYISNTESDTDNSRNIAIFNRQRSDMFSQQNIAGTQTARQCKDSTDLVCEPTSYCLQGSMVGRQDHNGPRGDGVNTEVSYTINTVDRHCVAAVDCRNYKEVGDISGTLQAKNKPGYSLNFQNPVRTGYIVRRLTPTECERLQGYPDGWTAFGHDGKPISDTARYMMLGNSVAVPCVAYIMLGIAEAHSKTGREVTVAD